MNFKIPDTPEELFRQGRKNIDAFSKWVPFIVVAFIICGTALSSFYSIDPDEVGVIRRFGKYVKTTEPGLHWKLPLVETLNEVKVKKVYTEEFGYRTIKPGIKTQYSTKSYVDESLMLTGDLNVLDVRWSVQFKINDPVKYSFNIRNPRETVRDLSEAVMRQIVGDNTVNEAITARRDEIIDEVKMKLQEILDSYNSGIYITSVKREAVNLPKEVKAAVNEVDQAKQEREKMINQAEAAYNKVIPKARGEAKKTISEAEGYALKRVNRAQGDVARFTAMWNAYKLAKDVTRRRLYLETLEDVLPKIGSIYVVEPSGTNILPLLNLNKDQQSQ